jgi:hypothetical protein
MSICVVCVFLSAGMKLDDSFSPVVKRILNILKSLDEYFFYRK